MNDTIASRVELIQGDITTLDVDAVVTAANEALCGGGGVDGAIHRAAGPGLLEECRTIGICPEGEARLTGGYRLAARHVIHTVGPVWEGGDRQEASTLASCYRSSLALAEANDLSSIAFPCVATGVYGYPKNKACDVAVAAVAGWLDAHDRPHRIIFCCFEDDDYALYREKGLNVAGARSREPGRGKTAGLE